MVTILYTLRGLVINGRFVRSKGGHEGWGRIKGLAKGVYFHDEKTAWKCEGYAPWTAIERIRTKAGPQLSGILWQVQLECKVNRGKAKPIKNEAGRRLDTDQWCQEPADCHMQALLVRGVHWSNLPTTGHKPPVILDWKPELEICPKVAMQAFSRLAPTKHQKGVMSASRRRGSTVGELKRPSSREEPSKRSTIEEPTMPMRRAKVQKKQTKDQSLAASSKDGSSGAAATEAPEQQNPAAPMAAWPAPTDAAAAAIKSEYDPSSSSEDEDHLRPWTYPGSVHGIPQEEREEVLRCWRHYCSHTDSRGIVRKPELVAYQQDGCSQSIVRTTLARPGYLSSCSLALGPIVCSCCVEALQEAVSPHLERRGGIAAGRRGC